MKTRMPVRDLVRLKIDKKAKPTMQEQGSNNMGIAIPGVVEDNVPEEFISYMDYCRTLQFEEKPDYSFLRRMFKDLFNRLGYEYDYVYDWSKSSKQSRAKHSSLNNRRHSNQQPALKNIGSPKQFEKQELYA